MAMKCVLHSYMVPDGPSNYAGPQGAKAITRCTVHDWTFEAVASLSCPIGRIEKAADEAIERIRKEKA